MGHAEPEGKDKGGKGAQGVTVTVSYRCGRGKMVVNVPEFLRARRIGRYRKLMELIRQSDTPEAADKVTAYIQEALDAIGPRAKEAAAGAVRTRTQAKEMQPDIDRLVSFRDRHKRGTERYKECSQRVKDARQIQRDLSNLARSYEAEFKALQKDKEFYQKVIALEDKG